MLQIKVTWNLEAPTRKVKRMALKTRREIDRFAVFTSGKNQKKETGEKLNLQYKLKSESMTVKTARQPTKHCKLQFLGFWTLIIARNSKYVLQNTTFRKLDVFLSSSETETSTLLGPLERDNLNQSIQ
jgi:hypothetical protein